MPCTNQHGRCSKKIEHIIKLQALGINSKTVNNIKNLTWGKNDQDSTIYPSCGTVALYGPLYIFFFADHRATVFTLSKTFETAEKKSCTAFLPIFVMKSGARTIKHIYFVSLNIYLHSSILTYLLIFISSSLS
jgi:hypothetical protein